MIKFGLILLCALSVWALPNHPLKVSQSKGGRIIGGEIARAGQFPYIAALYISTTLGTYFCSGTLFNEEWILTAAQCLDGATLISIRLGTNNLDGNDGLRLATDTYLLHPDFDASSLANDIGLIKLRLPITYTNYIQPVNFLADVNLPAGSSVLTVGWGQTSDEVAGLVNELNYVYLVSLTTEECRLTFGTQITDNMVCVDGNYNQGTCRGDLGSPLIQYGSRGITYHVGVSSFISSNGCESTDPSGFTRVSIYRNWIRDVTTANQK